MPNIDIAVDGDLRKLFNLPPCSEISIPGPKPLKVQLPTGGSISAFADISKGIPTDCSMTFSLLLQLAPFLAATECLIKVLKLLKPLIDVVKSLGPPPDPIKLPPAIEEFVKAAVELAPCFLVPTPANIIPFIRDLLCLLLRVLNCFLGQMKSLLGVMERLELKLNLEQQSGNFERISTIQCAQANANAHAQHLTASLEPVGVLLELASALFGIAGVPTIKLPTLGSQADLASLNAFVEAIQEVTAVIQVAADALGGCGE
jgi:hypothetical protein